jgi:hypothetical protein
MSDITVLQVGVLRRPEYQDARFQQRQADRLADNWDDRLVGTLVVNKRRGTWWLVDGNHRAAAARIKFGPSYEMRCETWDGLTPEEEFELYIMLATKRRPVTRFERFEGHRSVGRPAEVEIHKIAQECGFQVSAQPGGNHVNAVAVLEALYGLTAEGFPNPGPNLLRRTLTDSMATWGPHGGAGDGRFLSGLGAVLGFYPQISDKDLVVKLREHGDKGMLLAKAKALSTGSSKTAVANVIIQIYNNRRRAENKLPLLGTWQRGQAA